MKINTIKIIFVSLTVLVLFSFALPTNAATILPFCAYTGNCQICDFAELFINLANWGFGIIGGLALVYFVVGAVFLVMGGANPEKLTKGKTIIMNAIVGMLIVLSAWLIINFVVTALSGNEEGILNVKLEKKEGQPWYTAPGCETVSLNSVGKDITECYSLRDKATKEGNVALSDKQAEKLYGTKCQEYFRKFRDGGACKTNNKKINMVIKVEGVTPKCMSECEYLATYSGTKATYENFSCQDVTESNESSLTCETNLCPGGTNHLCCKDKTK